MNTGFRKWATAGQQQPALTGQQGYRSRQGRGQPGNQPVHGVNNIHHHPLLINFWKEQAPEQVKSAPLMALLRNGGSSFEEAMATLIGNHQRNCCGNYYLQGKCQRGPSCTLDHSYHYVSDAAAHNTVGLLKRCGQAYLTRRPSSRGSYQGRGGRGWYRGAAGRGRGGYNPNLGRGLPPPLSNPQGLPPAPTPGDPRPGGGPAR